MGGMPDMSMQPQGQPQMPPMDPNMGSGDQSMMGEDPNMGGDDPSMMGEGPNGQEMNQFDSNFDAGVQADEDEDPENYIKQLTGKLAQKLRSFNKENGQPDESLNKYTAKMIIKAAADGMSPEGRTELKKAVNTAKGSEDDVEDMSSDGSEEDADMNMGDEEEQMPIQEVFFTKKNLAEALNNMNNNIEPKQERPDTKLKKVQPSIYSGYKRKK